jgi:hypothetical protein
MQHSTTEIKHEKPVDHSETDHKKDLRMPPTQVQFDQYERECVIAACGASPMHPSLIVHGYTSKARYNAFCQQYGGCPWPPHADATDNVAQPAFCRLKIMAIAAESCPALRPAYTKMYDDMLAGVEIKQPAEPIKEESVARMDEFSLNDVIYNMKLHNRSAADLRSLHQVVRSTYAISSCASSSYPPVREHKNPTTGPDIDDAYYPKAFLPTATSAIHLACYKLLVQHGDNAAGVHIQAPASVSTYRAPLAEPTSDGGGYGDDGFGDILEEIAGSDELDMEAQTELKMMAGMAMAQMDRKRKFTRPRDDLGGRIYTHIDRGAMEGAITRCMKTQKAKRLKA